MSENFENNNQDKIIDEEMQELMRIKKERDEKKKLEENKNAFLNQEDPAKKEIHTALWEDGGLKEEYAKRPQIFLNQGMLEMALELAKSKLQASLKKTETQQQSQQQQQQTEAPGSQSIVQTSHANNTISVAQIRGRDPREILEKGIGDKGIKPRDLGQALEWSLFG